MTYVGDGEFSAFSHEGDRVVTNPDNGFAATFVAPGSVTDGQFGLFRFDMPRRGRVRPHFHRGFSESFYVLDGSVTFSDGRNDRRMGPGAFFHAPPGGIHGFGNDTDEPASLLLLFAPGIARERYFTELAEINASGRQLTQEEWADLFARHDQINL